MSTGEKPVEYASDVVNALLRQLGERRESRRLDAFARLQAFSNDQILDLLEHYFFLDLPKYTQSFALSSVGLVALIGVATAVVVSFGLAMCDTSPILPGTAVGICAAVIVGLNACYVRFRDAGLVYRFEIITSLLCKSEEPRIIGALCEFLNCPAGKRRGNLINSVRAALARLLPRHAANRMDLPNPDHRNAISRELRRLTYLDFKENQPTLSDFDREYAVAILKYMSAIGDTAALNIVENFYDRFAPYEPDSEIVREAARCLTVLREIKQAGSGRENLLRGSAAPDNGEELVRPAAAAAEDAESLPRAVEDESGEDRGTH